MSIVHDVGELRERVIKCYGLEHMNDQYTFYYDETNNVRKFCLKEDGYNSSIYSAFVLGGVMHKGSKSTADLDLLWNNMKLQKTIKEVKFRHLAKGNFLECLRSKKLNYYLKWLLSNDLYVHYSCLNLLYFSVIDIVDSAIANSRFAEKLNREYSDMMKNCLYLIVKNEEELFVDLFCKYQYPDIKREKIKAFIYELISIIEKFEDEPQLHLGLVSLRQILKESIKKEELIFVMHETANVLIDDLLDFYLRPIYMFMNSKHIFDKENSIEILIQDYDVRYFEKSMTNYQFVNSLTNRFIQISDIFVGLFGKFAEFINSNSVQEIQNQLANIESLQAESLDLFINLINRSERMNKALIFTTVSDEERMKYTMFNL